MNKAIMLIGIALVVLSGAAGAQQTDTVFRMGVMPTAVWKDQSHTSFLLAVQELGVT